MNLSVGSASAAAVLSTVYDSGKFDNNDGVLMASQPITILTVIKLFGKRTSLDTIESVIKFLCDTGWTQKTILTAAANSNYINAFPRALHGQQARIRQYFTEYGEDTPTILGKIVRSRLVSNDDITEGQQTPVLTTGTECVMDVFVMSFASMWSDASGDQDTAYNTHKVREHITSIEGYVDVLVLIDKASGFFHSFGRKKYDVSHPQDCVLAAINKWKQWFPNLKVIAADKGVASDDTTTILESSTYNLTVKRAPPGENEHRRIVALVEGFVGRWLKSSAAANWLRLLPHMQRSAITERNARKLWFLAVIHAENVMLLRPAYNNNLITRYEAGYKCTPNINDNIYMPFAWSVITTTLLPKQPNGNGTEGLYVGCDKHTPANILVYDLKSHKIGSHFSYRLVVDIPPIQQVQLDEIVKEFAEGKVTPSVQIDKWNVTNTENGTSDGGLVIKDVNAMSTIVGTIKSTETTSPGRVPYENNIESISVMPTVYLNSPRENSATANEGLVMVFTDGSHEPSAIPAVTCTALKPLLYGDHRVATSQAPAVVNDLELISGIHSGLKRSRGENTESVQLIDSKYTNISDNATTSSTCDEDEYVFDINILRNSAITDNSIPVTYTLQSSDNGNRNQGSSSDVNNLVKSNSSSSSVATVRPLMPTVPKRSLCHKDKRWNSAYLREMKVIKDNEAQVELAVNKETGGYVFPADCVVFRINVVHEYKWKKDPGDGVYKWLECARFTADASVDARPFTREELYAETPDGSLVMYFLNLCASMKWFLRESDSVRAYLQAPSIDTDTVVVYPDFLVELGMPKCALLKKGLYGTVMAALGYQRFSDDIFRKHGWGKLDVARGLYVIMDSPGVIGAICMRHSDNYAWAAPSLDRIISEVAKIGADIKMSSIQTLDVFLGMKIERINTAARGVRDDLGDVILARQSSYILTMQVKHAHVRLQYNPAGKVRTVAAPPDTESTMIASDNVELLPEDERKEYMAITGDIVWIAGRTRPSIKFESRELSSKNTKPCRGDMRRAVWLMDFLLHTSEMPLALGGKVVDPFGTADCSLGTAEESRSVIGGYVSLCDMSGAIHAFVKVLKCAITQIMEGEVYAAVEVADLTVYMNNLCAETGIQIPDVRRVYCDNKSGIDWIHGAVAMKGTKHYNRKLYRGRHLQMERVINTIYIQSPCNGADKLTKRTFGRDHVYKTALVQGHGLLLGLTVVGAWSAVRPVVESRNNMQGSAAVDER